MMLVRLLDWARLCPASLAHRAIFESSIYTNNLSIEPAGYNEDNNSICFTLRHKDGILDGVKVGVDVNFVSIHKQKGIQNVPMHISNFPLQIANVCRSESKKMVNSDYQSELLLCYMAILKGVVVENLVQYYEENDLSGVTDV